MTLLIILILVFLTGFAFAAISAAPWVPMRGRDVKELIADMNLTSNKTYVELGCGDGRLMLAVAQTNARAIGYEINPLLWFISWIRLKRFSNAHIRLGNFWKQNLSGADVVMAFLIPRTMPRLEKKLDLEMKKGASFISYVFKLPHKKPTKKQSSWLVYKY